MREKINVEEYGIDRLIYGKSYYIAYGGVTYGEEFVFTRKNRIELCEYQKEGDKFKKVSSRWISRRMLKKLLRSGYIHWMG